MELGFQKRSFLYFYSFLFSLPFLLSTITHVSSAADTITSGQSLTFGQTLISKAGVFELGFFNPGNSLTYYIGIWYKEIPIRNRTYVWVANRDTPLDDPTDPTSSELKLIDDGNLVLLNNLKSVVWSTNSTGNTRMNSSEVVLGDNGNLVLRNKDNPSDVFWQSFDYPTDTVLPGGRIRYNYRSKQAQSLTSWKSSSDPAKGVYSLELDPIEDKFLIIKNQTQRYWASGAWNREIFTRIIEMGATFPAYLNYTRNENESYLTFNSRYSSLTRLVMDVSGNSRISTWNKNQWLQFWAVPREACNIYSYCGVYGVCNMSSMPFCGCMDGFQPRSESEWNISDFSGGCVRKIDLQCSRNNQFLLMSRVRFPDRQQSTNISSPNECKFHCLANCSCTAYSYNNSVCSTWNQDLLNLEQVSYGNDLYVRLASPPSLTVDKNGRKAGIIVGIVGAVILVGLIVGCIVWKRRGNTKGNALISDKTRKEDLELPLFDLETIGTATNNFSLSNKIGQGGFGPVYKGVLQTGEEIAIKRLSKDSRQGLQEFMNEVLFIAKLQHRNLVRLLGCCIKGEERMLIYEYMPNKSLDFFIFDKTRSVNLNWQTRFSIIVGIARGLLYLHRDSRLRIIHRDLKASNVLLDNHMNPKIGDFGMARTFGGDQTQENTMRVVGTYGYMSPEYATDGLFSMKSDVFSFGVIILEIVSGEKNRGFHHEDHDLNLLGHAWKLLNNRNALEVVDASIRDPLTISEMIKCIQVGLLCVQKFPEDRPSMASVLSMLDGDGVMLPSPKQPGFYTERSLNDKDSSSTNLTKNEVTVTLLEGR